MHIHANSRIVIQRRKLQHIKAQMHAPQKHKYIGSKLLYMCSPNIRLKDPNKQLVPFKKKAASSLPERAPDLPFLRPL